MKLLIQTESDNVIQENILMIMWNLNVRGDNKRNVTLTLVMLATMQAPSRENVPQNAGSRVVFIFKLF